MSKGKWELINGPGRVPPMAGYDPTEPPKPYTNEFNIHFLIEGVPVCKWKTNRVFTEMSVSLGKLRVKPGKMCPKCFRVNK
jgi:hypothetical protein